ncbi:hypothetical protein GR927_07215 [Mycolicibacterium sp. 3033]|nr:hypothetical protein [Mycolicibacterium aurantiacum]
MVGVLRKVFAYEMTIAEWIGLAMLVNIPHILLGLLWTATHPDHLAGVHGVEKVAALIGGIAFWPVLWVAEVACPT